VVWGDCSAPVTDHAGVARASNNPLSWKHDVIRYLGIAAKVETRNDGGNNVRDSRMINEFKDFIAKGNVMDMAVGIIIGAAFTAIVTSLVDDLINPIISLFMGGIDFSGMKIALGEGADAAAFNYGSFINALINFLIVAFVVFLLVKMVNRVKDASVKKEEAAPAGPSELDVLLQIRDSLKK
jgi:large conductance mechanosensitive channel